jgi:UDPglucose 6-dehydrogenase
MNITIAGYGFVGKGYKKLLLKSSQEYKVTVSDPAFSQYNLGIPSNTDAVVICVATPQQEDGSCYMGNVFEVIEESPDVPILIKSTICLEGWRELKNKFPKSNLTFSPEFLRQDSWLQDILDMKSILIGGYDFSFWSDIFRDLECVESEAEALIITKYAKNNFLALKVSFFNQMYDLCCKLGVNYDEVREHTTSDSRIGDSHSFITKQRGFGGHCFPKDTSALVKTSEKYGCVLTIMHHARLYNNILRGYE